MKGFGIFLMPLVLAVSSGCSKGYRVRVSNFYYEKLDTVIVGRPEHIFTDIKFGQTTSYEKITSGDHSVRCVTGNGSSFYGTATLKKGGEGDFTIQIDGLKSIVVLQD
jgi:hypothetical protein